MDHESGGEYRESAFLVDEPSSARDLMTDCSVREEPEANTSGKDCPKSAITTYLEVEDNNACSSSADDIPSEPNRSNVLRTLSRLMYIIDPTNTIPLKPRTCNQCGETLEDWLALKEHNMKTHPPQERPYKCQECKESFSKFGQLKGHLKNSHPSLLFVCKDCCMSFADDFALMDHSQTHPKGLSHKCYDCGEGFSTDAFLKDHMISHMVKGALKIDVNPNTKRATPYSKAQKICKVCGKGFKDDAALRDHSRSHLEAKHKCVMCAKSFKEYSLLEDHLDTHYIRNKCEKCGKSFAALSNLQDHVRNQHPVDHPFDCNLCGKRLTNESHLRAHVANHSKPQKFKCPDCELRYTQRSSLDNHKIRMHGHMNCEQCGESIPTKKALKAHIYAHYLAGEFRCRVCGIRFQKYGALCRHLETHEI